MAKEFDIVVFGAYGFTGRFVALEIARRIRLDDTLSISWAISGRQPGKLGDVLSQIKKENEEREKSSCDNKAAGHLGVLPQIIQADVQDYASLVTLCGKARVLLNCVGPYVLYGEPVVKACIEAHCDYVDITGEPLFLHNIREKYDKEARDQGVLIVNTCGFDSVPSDVGVDFAKQAVIKMGYTPSICECYVEFFSTAPGRRPPTHNYGTWASIVQGITNGAETRKALARLPRASLPFNRPKLTPNRVPFLSREMGDRWCVLFPGSDVAVVRRTQELLYEKSKIEPVQVAAYYVVGSLWKLLVLTVFGALLYVMCQFDVGRQMLLKHPAIFSAGLFTRKGPDASELESRSFAVTIHAQGIKPAGSKDSVNVVVRVEGPDAGYVATSRMMTDCAIYMLKNREKLQFDAGIVTPASLFHGTEIVSWLDKSDIKFKIVSRSEYRDMLSGSAAQPSIKDIKSE